MNKEENVMYQFLLYGLPISAGVQMLRKSIFCKNMGYIQKVCDLWPQKNTITDLVV